MARKRKKKNSNILGIIVLILLLSALLRTCGNKATDEPKIKDDKSEKTEAVVDAPDLIMVEGFDELQSLFLQIDESYSEDQVKAMAEKIGFYAERRMIYGDMDWLYICTDKYVDKKLGAEGSVPLFDTDSIRITFTKGEDTSNKELHVFSKDYHGPTIDDIHNTLLEYTFYNDALELHDGQEVDWSTLEDSPWDSLGDALKQRISES